MIIPNWLESHKSHVPNHQPGIVCMIPYIEKNETYAKIMPAVTSLHDPSFWSTCRLMGEEVVVLVVLPKKQRGILFKEDGRRKKMGHISITIFINIIF